MKNINLYYGYIPQFSIDANLHPNRQIEELYKILLESTTDTIDIYCNSPYVLNEITLIEAHSHKNILHSTGISISNRHFEYLIDGKIVEGKYYKSMISDENLLNDKLGEANDKFSDLLDLEDKLKEKL